MVVAKGLMQYDMAALWNYNTRIRAVFSCCVQGATMCCTCCSFLPFNLRKRS